MSSEVKERKTRLMIVNLEQLEAAYSRGAKLSPEDSMKLMRLESAFLNKTFILNHTENDKISLNFRRIDTNHVSDLINETQETYLKRKS